ncbi:hypothetical protein OUZ56_031225 [Daphnia magna]|uniref:Uncharacterized protein n=1 Tax=Daphnia magna TaxID=35525 RepID=A0ABQ9ZTM5_9CRUS|nr:hypothetical protein OUZ56_031225 [Daphnia magna]
MPLGRLTDCPIPNQNASLPAPFDPWQTTTYRGFQQGYRSASSWNHTYMKPHLRRAERAHKTRAKEKKEEKSRMVSDTVYWDIVRETLEVTVAISVCAVTINKLRCNDARQSCTTSQMKARKIVVRTAVTSAANRLDLMATVAIDIPPATATPTPSSPPVEPLIRHISSTGIQV